MAPHDASMSAQHSNDMEGPSTLEHNDDSNVFSAKNELPNASHTSSALTKKKKKKKKAKNTAPASEIASDDRYVIHLLLVCLLRAVAFIVNACSGLVRSFVHDSRISTSNLFQHGSRHMLAMPRVVVGTQIRDGE